MKHNKSESGQALILIVLGIVALIGFTALALDGGNAFADRRQAQNAADTAALAAALSKVNDQDWQTAGQSRASSNGYTNDGVRSTVQIFSPPTEGPYTGDTKFVQVIIDSTVKTMFAPVIGVDEVRNHVTAVARAEPSTTQPMFFGHAIVSLSPDGCHNVRGDNGEYGGIWFHGNSQILVQGSGLFSNSNNSSCAFSMDGASTEGDAPYISCVGGYELPNNCDAFHGFPCLPSTPGGPACGAAAIPYPPPDMIFPDFACDSAPDAVISGSSIGTGGEDVVQVNEDFPPSGVTNVDPGIYCVMPGNVFRNNGNSDLTAIGVTIVVLGGDITWNGNGTITLEAPTTGSSAGLALYVPPGYSSTITINGTADSSIVGTILASESTCDLSGNEIGGFEGQVICWNVSLGGGGDTTVIYDDGQNYDSTVPPVIELTQ
jgi:Flp pilus assembly protein TadG